MFQALSIISLLLGAAVVQAAPTISRRDVSQGVLDQLTLFSQYAAAAYCPENHQPNSSTVVTCAADNCPLVQAAGAETLLEYQNVGPVDGTGYVAIDHSSQMIILAFRGSRSVGSESNESMTYLHHDGWRPAPELLKLTRGVLDWLANLNIVQKPYPQCRSCTVHAGFYDTWNLIKPQVEATLTAALTQYPNYRIVATGHSLGAAVASIAVGELREDGYTADLYSYGSPMAGNIAFVNYISGQGNNFRVTHDEDIVPKLPGYVLGYAHISDEYWITSDTGEATTTSDIQVSSGALNFKGNKGTLGSSVDDHSWYLGPITGCGNEDMDLPDESEVPEE